jgi:hypothetical protein
MNATEAFVGEPETWTYLRVELYDVHALWGGLNCFVWGSGRVVAQIAAVTQHEDRFAAIVPPGEIVRLVMALIETDFVSITFPMPGALVPDETCTAIHLINPAGEQARVVRCGHQAHTGFDALYQLLRQLAERARQGECLYQGPYDPRFVPTKAP